MRITESQLRHIIEEELDAVISEQSGPDIDMEELKKQIKQFVQKTNDDQKLDEGALSAAVIAHLIVGGLLALPLVIKYIGEAFQYLGKGINFASRIFTGKSKPATDDLQQKIQKGEATTGDLVTAMGKILEDHTAHWLHKKYLNFFTKVFGGAAGLLYFYKTGKKMDKTTKETIGKVFFYALVIYLCIAALKAGISGFTEHYGPTIITNSELILGMIKVDELLMVAGMEDALLSIMAVLGGKKIKDVAAQQKQKQADSHHADRIQQFADLRWSHKTKPPERLSVPVANPVPRTGVRPPKAAE